MEVINRQKLFLSFLKPAHFGKTLAFGAVAVTAGVIGWMAIPAQIAHFHVSTQI